MSDSDHGTPFDEYSPDPIDDWSRAVFDASRDWPLACSGRWFRVEEGWLRLRIEEVDGERLEPLFAIDVDTPDGQILVDFGSWGTPISPSSGALAHAAKRAVAEARGLVEDWLCGVVKLASYSDETGWRGSKIIHGGELPAAIEPVPVAIGAQGRVIVKTPRRSDWRAWRHMGDGLWIECEIGEAAD
jgi:hypothetical protein